MAVSPSGTQFEIRHCDQRATIPTNIGDHACPYGAGQHPYLSPGTGLINERHSRPLCFDPHPHRQRPPTPNRDGDGRRADFDFRAGKRLGDQKLDTPFTDLDRDQDG